MPNTCISHRSPVGDTESTDKLVLVGQIFLHLLAHVEDGTVTARES